MPATSPQECRARAKACEELAETATNPETRETLLYLAKRWRDLADEDEAKELERDDRSGVIAAGFGEDRRRATIMRQRGCANSR